MKEREKRNEERTCSTGRCSTNQIWIGMAIIIIIIAITFIFGK